MVGIIGVKPMDIFSGEPSFVNPLTTYELNWPTSKSCASSKVFLSTLVLFSTLLKKESDNFIVNVYKSTLNTQLIVNLSSSIISFLMLVFIIVFKKL